MTSINRTSEVYLLQKNTDDPRFEGFGFDREDSIRGKTRINVDFMPDDIASKGRAWTITRMAHLWTPQHVSGRVRPYNDYPCCNLIIPAFSERAVAAMRDLLEPNGELLPLISPVGNFYAYNITTVADVLDHATSGIRWYEGLKTTLPSEIERYEFYSDRIQGLSIFRIVESPSRVYVTSTFVDRVRTHRLQGFVFTKLWPDTTPDDCADDSVERDGVTSQSVIVQLALAKSKPNKAEKQRIEALMDQIDLWLFTAEREGKYLGSLEGHEYTTREGRLFLSCPNADQLSDWLTPQLRAVSSDGQLSLTKRYGPYDSFGEKDAQEVRFKIR